MDGIGGTISNGKRRVAMRKNTVVRKKRTVAAKKKLEKSNLAKRIKAVGAGVGMSDRQRRKVMGK